MAWSNLSRQARGYGATWDRLRKTILQRDGHLCRCADCTGAGLVTPATHVDHKISKAVWQREHGNLDGVDHPSNLQSMNKDCHKRKTQLEMGRRPRAGCDEDGNPLDPGHHWNRK